MTDLLGGPSSPENFLSVNLKNPSEVADLMGKKMFKNIAEEFFKTDKLHQDYGMEVTLFDSDIIVLSDESVDLPESTKEKGKKVT